MTANRRPRLLFLAYAFPPLSAPATPRARYIAKYLARSGWDITVVTPHPSYWRRTDHPEEVDPFLKREGIHRIATGLRWQCLDSEYVRYWDRRIGWLIGGICRRIAKWLSIESQIGWVSEIESSCQGISLSDIDIIMATGNPWISFRAASLLGQRIGVPFVLDYRDLWNTNPHLLKPLPRRIAKEEETLINSCAAVTAVSPSLADSLRRRFQEIKNLFVVTNGFDPDDLSNIQPYNFGHFAIVYAGNFYTPKRVITPLMKAMQQIDSTDNGGSPEWRFHYYGKDQKHVALEAEKHGVIERTVFHGHVPRQEVLSAVAGAGVNVVITSVLEEGSLEDRGIITSKVFEALGLGSKILLIAPAGSDVILIVEGSNCGQCFSGSQTDEIASYLRKLMTGGQPKPKPPTQYAWPEIIRPLDSQLRKILHEHTSVRSNPSISSSG